VHGAQQITILQLRKRLQTYKFRTLNPSDIHQRSGFTYFMDVSPTADITIDMKTRK
jgi:hypothetical protein